MSDQPAAKIAATQRTTKKKQKNIYAFNGIWTLDPSNSEVAELHFINRTTTGIGSIKYRGETLAP
jgi:hypothetical protein